MYVCVRYKKKTIPYVQVKNTPRVIESGHEFLLGLMVIIVANTKSASYHMKLFLNPKCL